MQQFRDRYSGALIIKRSDEEIESRSALNEMREIRDEIKAERERIEQLKRGDGDGDTSKQDPSE